MADNPYLMDEKSIPKNWSPIGGPLGALSAPAPPVPHDMPQFFSGSIPSALQHDASFVGTEVGSPRIPKYSLMPLGAQMSALTSAAIQSTTKIVVNQAIAAIPPTATTTVTDGLIHGDAVWEHDSAYVEIRDDFTTGTNSIGAVSGTGELGWFFGNSASTSGNYISNAPPNIGLF